MYPWLRTSSNTVKCFTFAPWLASTSHSPLVTVTSSLTGHLKSSDDRGANVDQLKLVWTVRLSLGTKGFIFHTAQQCICDTGLCYLQSECNLWPSDSCHAVTLRWSYTGGRSLFWTRLRWWRWFHHRWFGWRDGRCHGPLGKTTVVCKYNTTAVSSVNRSRDRCGVEPHIDPDVAGLFVDDQRMDRVSKGLQALLSAGLVLICRDEERWRQQDQLEMLLTPVHHDHPRTDREGEGEVWREGMSHTDTVFPPVWVQELLKLGEAERLWDVL